MKYTFIQESDNGTKITHEFVTLFHDEVADRFNEFLLGCGFVFDGERYGLVSDDEYQTPECEFEDWPIHEDEGNCVMSWTSEELSKTEPLYTIREPGQFQDWQSFGLCQKCKISKSIMRNAKCFDANCGMV